MKAKKWNGEKVNVFVLIEMNDDGWSLLDCSTRRGELSMWSAMWSGRRIIRGTLTAVLPKAKKARK